VLDGPLVGGSSWLPWSNEESDDPPLRIFRKRVQVETTCFLVGDLEHFLFFNKLRIIIPSDYINFSEGLKPPTSFCLFTLGPRVAERFMRWPRKDLVDDEDSP